MIRRPPRSTPLSLHDALPISQALQDLEDELADELQAIAAEWDAKAFAVEPLDIPLERSDIRIVDRKSTRLNSSHSSISYAVFCLKKKKLQPDGNCRVGYPA